VSQIQVLAPYSSDRSASLADDQHPRRNVPGLDIRRHVAIQATRTNETQIQGCRSQTTHRLTRMQKDKEAINLDRAAWNMRCEANG
jgi:hypothetical protein